jgi:hypothetical protein
MGKMYANAPVTAHPHGIMTMMYRKYNLKDLFYLDNWPVFDYRQIVIADPVCNCIFSRLNPSNMTSTFMFDSRTVRLISD